MTSLARILGITVLAAIVLTVVASLVASAPDIARYLRMRSM